MKNYNKGRKIGIFIGGVIVGFIKRIFFENKY